MRILVTNDDGIDSVGLHVLAGALKPLGEVVIVAPDTDYSGSSASIGALWLIRPEVHEAEVDGIDTAWAVSGPPGLCAMFARLGAFGPPPDLIVSGINPGANVGRSVYHSGTIGAALTGRNGGIPGVAISQSVSEFGVEGQGWEDTLTNQKWEVAATVAREIVTHMVDDLVGAPNVGVLNVNVPNVELDEIAGYAWTTVGEGPPRSMSTAMLEPKPGHAGSYRVKMSWGEPVDQPQHTDTGAILHDRISLSWLSRITAEERPSPRIDAALSRLLAC